MPLCHKQPRRNHDAPTWWSSFERCKLQRCQRTVTSIGALGLLCTSPEPVQTPAKVRFQLARLPFNLRRMYLLNTNYADLSFLFTILAGEKTNAHLGTEYLAVLETDNSTPYFLNLHNGEIAHTLILGMTGSGKFYLANFILQNAQKYAPLTYIFDIGGNFQSLTTIFGGSYLNVGQDLRDFTVNPFSLPPSKENLQFLFKLLPGVDRGQRTALSPRLQRGTQTVGRDRAHVCFGCGTAYPIELRQHRR